MNNDFSDLQELLFKNRGEQTLEILDKILSQSPNDVTALLGKSSFLSKLGNYTEAIEGYTQAIQFASGEDLSLAYAGRAFNYYQIESFQEALDDCECALKLNPNESILWKTKGCLLCLIDLSTETMAAAITAFQRGLEINPSDQKMIGLKEYFFDIFQEKLEKSEKLFLNTIDDVMEELKERRKYDSDEMQKSDDFMEEMLEAYRMANDLVENLFKKIPSMFEARNECLTIYYYIRSVNSGINAIYPTFDEKELEVSRKFFEKAKEIAIQEGDNVRIAKIVPTQHLLEERSAVYKVRINNESSNNVGKSIALPLGIGVFSLVLLFAGQWLIGLIGLGVTYWLWNS